MNAFSSYRFIGKAITVDFILITLIAKVAELQLNLVTRGSV